MFGRRVVLTLFHQCWLLGKLFTQCFILNMFELYYIMLDIHTVTCFIDSFWMVCLVKYWITILKTCLFQIFFIVFLILLINSYYTVWFSTVQAVHTLTIYQVTFLMMLKNIFIPVFLVFLLYNMKCIIICKTTIYI